jgi:uncharacterized repeat protein (TIGR01451 family)
VTDVFSLRKAKALGGCKPKTSHVIRTIALLALALALAIAPRPAVSSALIALTNSVALVEVNNGTAATVPFSGTAKPGDHLRYTIAARNTGDRPATKLVPSVHLPAGEAYVDGSAGVDAEFSVDGGRTWSREPLVRMTASDGTVKLRRAQAREYQAIRWTAPAPLAAGATAFFRYDVIVE